ncbi:MAG TPA: type II toxin-antitoxin system Phd/YefM family antitoxin [Anaerolineae bacterium]|nr:type II toxin-antitoxin system Phd/YefM family antitoxin [Anaerolineae bacterium]
MFKTFSIAEARHSLAELVHQLERQPIIHLTRRGKPVAVLLSQREFERLTATRTPFWDAYTVFRKSFDLVALDIEPNIFHDTRDRSLGREMEW